MCRRSGGTDTYTRAKRDSLRLQELAGRLPAAENGCVICAVAVVGLVTWTIVARPPAVPPMISPCTCAVEKMPGLAVKVAVAPTVAAVAGTVSVAPGLDGAG